MTAISPSRFADRREKLRPLLKAEGLDALVVSLDANRYYLSGFELHDPQTNESAGLLLITASGRDYLLTDSRYLDAARRLWAEDGIFIYGGDTRAEIRDFIAGRVTGTVGIEAGAMKVGLFLALQEAPGLTLKPLGGLVEKLRVIKEPEEIEIMRRSCAVNHIVCEATPSFLVPGRTEAEVAWDIEKCFRDNGCSELSFASIVAAGPNGALPHAIPGRDPVPENGPMLVDIGGRLDDYCSDQTRTFWVGEKPSDVFRRTMDLVREAQRLAIEAMKPGAPLIDPYRAAMAHFEENGEGTYFTHSLGHGVGLETHEPPRLGLRSENVLRPGMVVTAEPGLYYPEWGGVRWEYMVLITKDGCEVL